MHSIYRPARTRNQMAEGIRGEIDPARKPELIRHCTLRYLHIDGSERIRYHDTDIVIRRPNGQLEVNTGGFGHSPNTRSRIGEGLTLLTGTHYAVWGNGKGALTLYRRNPAAVPGDYASHWSKVADFRDRLTIGPRGKVTSDYRPERQDKLVRMVDRYIREWSKRGIPTPADSMGDPWIFGPASVDRGTMMDWVKTRYVARSILAAAIEDAGRNEWAWMPRDGGKPSNLHLRWLRRFVKRKLGLS